MSHGDPAEIQAAEEGNRSALLLPMPNPVNAWTRPIPLKNSLVARGASVGLQRDKWICELFEGSISASLQISALEFPMQVLASPPVTSIGT
jgi:hypothetical protein